MAITLSLVAAGILYQESVRWLVMLWSERSYSHGYFVPLISLYLVWEQRERFKSLCIRPRPGVAMPLICCCLMLLFISRYSATIQLEAISLFLIIPSTIIYLFGWKILQAATLPCLYLLFMFPGFNELMGALHPYFQRISALLGAKLLGLFYPVFLDDLIIQLPAITMQVARECSGVNFLISVLAIAIPLVYLTQRSWNKALWVIILGCILTVLANGIRVALAGVMGQLYGPELLHGPGHIFQGWFVAWFGWVGLFFINWLFSKYSQNSSPLLHERWQLYFRPSDKEPSESAQLSSKNLWHVAILFALFASTKYFASPLPSPLPTPLSSFPISLDGMRGLDIEWLDNETVLPSSDDELQRIYRSSATGRAMQLYIAYYATQREEGRLISRFSRPFHKGAVRINLPTNFTPWAINKTSIDLGGKPYDVFFWYQFPRQKVDVDRNNARLTALKNGISTRHNNGAFVLIAKEKNSSGNSTLSDEAAPFSFIKDTRAALNTMLP